MNRTAVLLIFGGESSEHDVSVMSARNVYAAMDNERYEVHLCYIDQKGKWWLLETWQESLDNHGGVQLSAVPGTGSFLTIPGNNVLHIDVVFPVMHGENGHEDGAVQGMMNLVHIPVVGSGIGASAACWNKLFTKQLLGACGIGVVPYVTYRRGESLPIYSNLSRELGEHMFVKPTTAGSSVGVSKVRHEGELEPAIVTALEIADTVLIEKAITGRELEVAVLGTPPNHTVSGIGEIIPGEDFYSYNDKYAQDSKARVLSKIDIADELGRELQRIAHQAYAALGCKGLARVDFLVSESGEIYVNEINTIPGFTNISQYPKLWQESGMSYPALIDELITDTLQ